MVKLNSTCLVGVLACLGASGVYAGPCKPIISQTTSAAIFTTTHVTSATTEESTVVDLSTTITAVETTSDVPSASTTGLSSETTEDSTIELTTTTTADTTSEAPTTTTTEGTTTTTSPLQCPTPVTCDNLGFDWAYYQNSARNTDTTYSSFHPDSFKRVDPLYVGTTNQIGGLYQSSANTPQGSIYGSTTDLNLDQFALNHHAFIYACETGTYKFDIPYANDAVYLWLGAKAYAGWTDNNADAKARYNQVEHIAGKANFQVDIPAGTYIPVRFVYGQAQYGGGFQFTVTAPSGQVLVSNGDISSPYVVRYSCDGITAPRYPAFGREI
ncbi:hypothetical protein FSARC_3782 [Fusarium sarcochroum]|uniref:PA14 domain-containing protein n=1 Tax=Fusarium sarcochroum TaxID=1208366 RepID=A0A8H4XBC7_9HYPO|nr:hypothetical protein FSARC_3782 [Fusarium sarcochroum]